MSESLSNSEQIGGVSVTVGADIGPLKEKISEAKEAAKAITELQPKMRVVADTAGLQAVADHAKAVAATAAGAMRAVADTAVIKPRFDFQESQVRDRMAALINGMRKQAAEAKIEVTARTRLFGEPEFSVAPAGPTNFSNGGAINWESRFRVLNEKSEGDEREGDGGGGGSSILSFRNLTRHLTMGMLAFEGLRIAQSMMDYNEQMRLAGNDQRAKYTAESKFADSIEQVPLVGQVAGLIAEGLTGSRAAAQWAMRDADLNDAQTKQMGESYGFRVSQEELHQRIQTIGPYEAANAAAQQANRSRVADIHDEYRAAVFPANTRRAIDNPKADQDASDYADQIWGGKGYREAMGTEQQWQNVYARKLRELHQGIDAQYRQAISRPTTDRDNQLTAAQSDYQHQLDLVGGDKASALSGLRTQYRMSNYQEVGAAYDLQQNDLAKFNVERAANRAQISGEFDAKLAGKNIDPDMRKQLEQNRGKALEAADKETETKRADLVRQQGAENTRLVATAGADRLRIAHDNFGAEMLLVKAEGDAKVHAANSALKASVAAANVAQQNLMVAEHTEQVLDLGTQYKAVSDAARMRISGDQFGASMAGYDADTEKQLRRAAPYEVDTLRQTRLAQRAGMTGEHGVQIAEQGEDLQAQTWSAQQVVAGQSERASVTQELRRIIESVENAAPELKGKAQEAAQAQLSAITAQHTVSAGGAIVRGEDRGQAGAELLQARAQGAQDKLIAGDIAAARRQVAAGGSPAVLQARADAMRAVPDTNKAATPKLPSLKSEYHFSDALKGSPNYSGDSISDWAKYKNAVKAAKANGTDSPKTPTEAAYLKSMDVWNAASLKRKADPSKANFDAEDAARKSAMPKMRAETAREVRADSQLRAVEWHSATGGKPLNLPASDHASDISKSNTNLGPKVDQMIRLLSQIASHALGAAQAGAVARGT